MVNKGKVPDAWEEDWESAADREEEAAPAQQAPPPEPMSKAERLAQHAESNRRLWESAEAPSEPTYFLASSATGNVPLATGFKPAMKVLSRKPAPRMVARRDPVTGLERLTPAGDGDDDDDDDDGARKAQPTPEEIRMRQQRELEEKQRRYEEARAKIFGDTGAGAGAGSNSGSGSGSRGARPSTPGAVTPPEGRQGHRGKGRGRGGFRGDGHSGRNDRSDSHGRRAAGGSQPGGGRELYDPNYSPKPGLAMQRRGGESASPARASTPREEEDQVLRGPRGPDGSGRGGFGFAKRGAKEG